VRTRPIQIRFRYRIRTVMPGVGSLRMSRPAMSHRRRSLFPPRRCARRPRPGLPARIRLDGGSSCGVPTHSGRPDPVEDALDLLRGAQRRSSSLRATLRAKRAERAFRTLGFPVQNRCHASEPCESRPGKSLTSFARRSVGLVPGLAAAGGVPLGIESTAMPATDRPAGCLEIEHAGDQVAVGLAGLAAVGDVDGPGAPGLGFAGQVVALEERGSELAGGSRDDFCRDSLRYYGYWAEASRWPIMITSCTPASRVM
jgi:hypothetical protein